jgi:hypothetical protein
VLFAAAADKEEKDGEIPGLPVATADATRLLDTPTLELFDTSLLCDVVLVTLASEG